MILHRAMILESLFITTDRHCTKLKEPFHSVPESRSSLKARAEKEWSVVIKLTIRAESNEGESLLCSKGATGELQVGQAEGDVSGTRRAHEARKCLDSQNTCSSRHCQRLTASGHICDGFQPVHILTTVKNDTSEKGTKQFCFLRRHK